MNMAFPTDTSYMALTSTKIRDNKINDLIKQSSSKKENLLTMQARTLMKIWTTIKVRKQNQAMESTSPKMI